MYLTDQDTDWLQKYILLYIMTGNNIWVKRDQPDVTCFIISLFNAQHVYYSSITL